MGFLNGRLVRIGFVDGMFMDFRGETSGPMNW